MKYRWLDPHQGFLLEQTGSTQDFASLPPQGLILLSPPLFPFQSNEALLGVIGIAVMIIIVLLTIIVTLFWVMRRSSKPQSPTPPPPIPEVPVKQDNIPTVLTVAPPPPSDPTVPAISTKQLEGQAQQPTLPAIKRVGEPETMPISGRRPALINWQIAGMSHVGLKRQLNEDNLVMVEAETGNDAPYGLYVVADGMGGHESGEIASQLTIDTIQTHLLQESPPLNAEMIEAWFDGAIKAANETVIAHQAGTDKSRKMGSTLVMAMVVNSQAHIANVGDSRAYRLTSETIQQISVDHSLVERLVEIKQITREEARTHKQRNVIYSTIGDKPKVQIGFYHIDLNPGDRLLLCSDGLTTMLTDEQILNISRDNSTIADACNALVKAANAAGGDDNITVILVEMNQ